MSSAPTTWQATSRLIHQLETYLGGIARELRDVDGTAYADDAGVWQLP